MAAYTIKGLCFSYPEQKKKVLEDINLEIQHGEFVVLCGLSGCGKTTLLRQLKPILAPCGNKSGNIFFEDMDISELGQREQSTKIGFVLQSQENQIVTDKVWHELAFGLESLGLDTQTIRLRVAEMASFFGIENWFHSAVSELSGGQKQLLNLAAIMAMQPTVLILDEPTSQLDPIAASEFLAMLGKINREIGTTILLTEHRLEEALPLADRLLVLDDGNLIADDTPKAVGELLAKKKHSMFAAMPTPMQIYSAIPNELPCPITVRDGRNWLDAYAKTHALQPVKEEEKVPKTESVLELENIWFRYEENTTDVVRGLDLTVYKGEFFALLGGNGTGKSTILSLSSGIYKPHRGRVKVNVVSKDEILEEQILGELIGVLPQNPQTLFVKKTVELDLLDGIKHKNLSIEESKIQMENVINLCELEGVLKQHPYDLSGGEQQRVALAKILLLDTPILLLDEPTKGLDAEFKKIFADILKKRMEDGVTIFMVSHDVAFCAQYAERCAMMFDGKIVGLGTPQTFFGGNGFYTTAANRMARHLLPNAITPEDIVKSCGKTIEENKRIDTTIRKKEEKPLEKIESKQTGIFFKILKILSLILLGVTLICGGDIGTELTNEFYKFGMGKPLALSNTWQYFAYLLGLCISITGVIVGFMKTHGSMSMEKTKRASKGLSKRTKVATILVFFLIPLTMYIGTYYFGNRKYYFIGLLIILQTILPFVLAFEERKPQARELVLIASLCAIGVVGRSVFFMLPQFKPVVALVILVGIAFGGEVGFLVGAITAFASNMFFGQGPWTPWQMFAFGIIGFWAGILFQKGWLSKNILSFMIFGALSTTLIYGGIMDLGTYFMYQNEWNQELFLATILMGIPFNVLHGVSTIFFLGVFGNPMLEKLERIKIKYGLLE